MDDLERLEAGIFHPVEQPLAATEQDRSDVEHGSSTTPAASAWRTVEAPPAISTPSPSAAALARSNATSKPSVTKWNVVPPLISIGSCGWWVRTNTGA